MKLQKFSRIVSITGLVLIFSGCSVFRANEPEGMRYQYKPQYGFVRIEGIETGARDNEHPLTIAPNTLRQALASVKVTGSVTPRSVPVFSEEELKEFVPPLVTALAQAGPREDVTFAVTGKHGWLGQISPRRATTGRLFVRGGRLNVIFGLVHAAYESGELGGGIPAFTPGLRARRIDSIWSVAADNAGVTAARADWLAFDIATLAAQKVPTGSEGAVAPSLPTVDSRFRELENRLQVLEHLKANGLISEEEYRQRRRAILEGI